ncbi:24597_t:CDS:1, partial [Gigaspora margarita]
VNEQSILFELKSTNFSDLFPIDIMYLLYENIPNYMFKHWYVCFYPNNSSLNVNEYTIQKSIWATIGKTIDINQKSMPTCFGQPPKNIVNHHDGFKAEEWANWIVLYSMPLLRGHLPKKIMQE